MRRIGFIMLLLSHASSVAVRTALRDAVAALHKAKVPEAQASAEWLLAHALGESDRNSVTRAIATKGVLDTEQQAQFSALIARRLKREPVQYIVGAWAFHDIELELEPPTLIPRSGRGVQTLRFVCRGDGVEACESAAYAIAATSRGDGVEGLESATCTIEVSASTETPSTLRRRRPETEELVDLVLDWWGNDAATFADVGSGSGCLGLALLNKLPEGSSCTAIDISEAAVALSTRNAKKLGLSSVYDASQQSAADLTGSFDFIVSNPPYIPSRDLQGLDAEVVDFEDPRALDGGADGLDVARELLDRAPLVLRGDRKSVWLELDETGPALLARSFACESFVDLAGKERFARVDF